MTNPTSDNKPRKPWVRSVRFALYAVILLALLVWMRQENDENNEGMPAANLKRRLEADAEYQRAKAAYALVSEAASTRNPVEKMRLYDEIINTYQGDQAESLKRYVSWAVYKKALALTDPLEKSHLLEKVIDNYLDSPDRQVKSYVMAALAERLNLIARGVEKIAFCDGILEKHDGRLPDSLAVWLLSEKAKLTSGAAEQVAIYDMILSRFQSSKDDTAFDFVVIAALDKMLLVTDVAEQVRLCDIAIDAYLKTPFKTRYYLFDTAIEKKAELVGDPSLPLTLYNQVIANNVTEESVVQARSARMPFLKDDNERLAACDEFIGVHQGSKSDFVKLMVARAMARKAGLVTDAGEKTALMRAVIEKCADIEDSRAEDLVAQMVEKLAELSGDADSAVRFYEEKTAWAKNDLDAIHALSNQAKLVKDPAEKLRLYNEIIAKGGNSRDKTVSREVTRSMLLKVDLTDDREEKIKLYDEIIARTGDDGCMWEWADAAGHMLNKALLLDDKEARVSVYDEIIGRGRHSGNKKELEKAAQAMLEKAKLTGDDEEKITVYDTVLFDLGPSLDHFILQSVFRDRIDLAGEAREKLRLYDRYLAQADKTMPPARQMTLLLEKAEFMTDKSEKLRLYEEIIEKCERDLNVEDSVGRKYPSIIQKSLYWNILGKAIIAAADLRESAEDKLKLYDRYLASPKPAGSHMADLHFDAIASQKIKLSGDPSIMSRYFDEKIQAAATDFERVDWYVRKAKIAEKPNQAEIEEEMIAKFFDNNQQDVEGVVAGAFLDKIRRTSDSIEKEKLCDRLIERYGDSPDNRALYAVVRAFLMKARASNSDDTKLELYSAVIDRYLDINDFLVKSVVDEALAAKFRLENKRLGKKKAVEARPMVDGFAR